MIGQLERVLAVGASIGEGPVWCSQGKALYWIDIFGSTINRFDPAKGTNTAVATSQWVCAMSLREGGGAIGAVEDGLAFIDPISGQFEIVANPLPDRSMRFNDGACDRRGRFWSGTMLREDQKPICSLYRLSSDLTLTEMDSGLTLSNGIGFSPDDTTMYLSDSLQATVFAYDFDLDSATISNKRPLIVVANSEGLPDGLTVDSEGCIWLAHWDGWKVTRHAPDGKEIASVQMPIPRPTSCAFGGDDLSTLYITSARFDLSPDQLETSPMSGDLFAVKTSARGLAEPTFVLSA